MTARDREVLSHLKDFQILTREHIQALAFPAVSPRIAQERLRHLWTGGYVARGYFRGVVDGSAESVRNLGTPVYTLTRKGASLVAEGEPHGKHARFKPSAATMKHHLVAVDFLVALKTATGRGVEVSTAPEVSLRSLVSRAPRSLGPSIIPDGALTIHYPDSGRTYTFPLEVVKAGVRSGNGALAGRFREYVSRIRSRWFEKAYGFAPVRALLVLTPSKVRAKHYQNLAASLDSGRGFIWVTDYERLPSAGPPLTKFKGHTILDHPFVDGNGRTFTLHSPNTNHAPL